MVSLGDFLSVPWPQLLPIYTDESQISIFIPNLCIHLPVGHHHLADPHPHYIKIVYSFLFQSC